MLLSLILAISCVDKISDTGNVEECLYTLPQEDLSNLRITLMDHIAMQAGSERTLELGTIECCVYIEPVDACVDWSVSPSEGARIDEDGVLRIYEGVTHGSIFTVEANVEDGRHRIELPVYIYEPEQNPLYGKWSEHKQISCLTGEEIEPAFKIAEMYFYANGIFDVTWDPFEAYRDYWGPYTYDLTQGSLLLEVDGGNYIPPDVDGDGSFYIDESGALHLDSIWLGTPMDMEVEEQCGHIFRR